MFCQSATVPIIKPVNGLCNLACSYCYAAGLREFDIENRMKPEVLKATIDFFCKDQENIEFIWHGGEPLLAGLDFYREVGALQQKWKQKGKKITNFLQTNATLITKEWVDFFASNNFFVGTSLDGPEEFNDQVRYYSEGKGSYKKVMRGINLLQQAGIFNGVICGISAVNYKFPEQIFDFFIKENIKKLKFARIKNIGYYGNTASLNISPAQYYNFMISIFDLWVELDNTEVEIRDIESVVNLIFGGKKRECIYLGQCDKYVTVYFDGSIYSCDSFEKEERFHFGRVFDKPIKVKANLQLQIFRKLLEKKNEHCKKCDWYFVCRGGCLKDCYKQFISEVEPLNESCEDLKRYFAHISAKLKSYTFI